jgi:acyl-CoA oxidase
MFNSPATESSTPESARSPDLRALLVGEPEPLSAYFREFLEGFERPVALPLALYRELVLEWCHKLAGAGFGRLGLPKAMGGDPRGLFLLCENLAIFDPSLMVKFGVHVGLIQATIAKLGTQRHQRWLESTPTFDRIGCFAMTETGHGSDVRGLETVARYLPESDEFEITTPHRAARKDYIGSAALHGDFAVVFAQLEVAEQRHGVHAFLVDIRDSEGKPLRGIEIEDCGAKAGLNGVDNGRLGFAAVRIPRDNLLNRYGDVNDQGRYETTIKDDSTRFFTMLANLLAGRLMVCAATWAGARASLAIAVHYGLRRRQFGKPESLILDYQAHQKRLIPRLAQAYAVSAALDDVRQEYLTALDQDSPAGRPLETRIAALKAYCSWTALATVQTCRECCGGAAYLAENRLGAIRADLDVFTTFEGDNTVLGLLVAKNLLAEFKEESQGSFVFTAGRLVQSRWSKERTLLMRAGTESAMKTSKFQRAAFRMRRERLTFSLAQRLTQRLKEGQTVSAAFNACQDHALALAWAYASECVYDAFARQVKTRETFRPLRDLFALWTLENEAAFFLEKDLLSGSQLGTIRGLVLKLSAELRDYAEELVNYFDISDRLLGASGLLDPEA